MLRSRAFASHAPHPTLRPPHPRLLQPEVIVPLQAKLVAGGIAGMIGTSIILCVAPARLSFLDRPPTFVRGHFTAVRVGG